MKFAEEVRSKGAEPVFMMTWAYKSNPLMQPLPPPPPQRNLQVAPPQPVAAPPPVQGVPPQAAPPQPVAAPPQAAPPPSIGGLDYYVDAPGPGGLDVRSPMVKQPLNRRTLNVKKPGIETTFRPERAPQKQIRLDFNDLIGEDLRMNFSPAPPGSHTPAVFHQKNFRKQAEKIRTQLRAFFRGYGIDPLPVELPNGTVRSTKHEQKIIVRPLNGPRGLMFLGNGELNMDTGYMAANSVSPDPARRALVTATLIHEELHNYGPLKSLFNRDPTGNATANTDQALLVGVEEFMNEVAARHIARQATGYPFPLTVDDGTNAYQHTIDNVIDTLGTTFFPNKFQVKREPDNGDIYRTTTPEVLGTLEDWLEQAGLMFKQYQGAAQSAEDMLDDMIQALYVTRPIELSRDDLVKIEYRLGRDVASPYTFSHRFTRELEPDLLDEIRRTLETSRSSVLSIRDLRAASSLDPATFDQNLLDLMRRGNVDLYEHDGPSRLSPDAVVVDEQGRTYNAVVLKEDP